MAVLLTGGTGKTSLRVARLLQDAHVPFLAASRRGEAGAPAGIPAVRFDWLDASTFENPFNHNFPSQEGISAVYLIAPEVPDPTPHMNAFIDLAVEKYLVKRFVLLAGASVEKGGHFVGKVWKHLVDIGVEYCVLRPSWFMGARCHADQSGQSVCSANKDGKNDFPSRTISLQLSTKARSTPLVEMVRHHLSVLWTLQRLCFGHSPTNTHTIPTTGFWARSF